MTEIATIVLDKNLTLIIARCLKTYYDGHTSEESKMVRTIGSAMENAAYIEGMGLNILCRFNLEDFKIANGDIK